MKKRSAAYNDTLKEYKKLAKQADQRIVRLEEMAKEPGRKNILNWAYARAAHDIKKYETGKKGERPRFNRNIPEDLNRLRAKLADVKHFLLETVTSTRGGINKMIKKRQKTFKTEYGIDLTEEQIVSLFKRGKFDKFDSQYGSKTTLKAFGKIQANRSEIRKQLKRIKRGDVQDLEFTEGSKMMNETILSMLLEHEADLKKLKIL